MSLEIALISIPQDSFGQKCKKKSDYRHDVLPIVMGAKPEDYARSAPHHSYIHVVR